METNKWIRIQSAHTHGYPKHRIEAMWQSNINNNKNEQSTVATNGRGN